MSKLNRKVSKVMGSNGELRYGISALGLEYREQAENDELLVEILILLSINSSILIISFGNLRIIS